MVILVIVSGHWQTSLSRTKTSPIMHEFYPFQSSIKNLYQHLDGLVAIGILAKINLSEWAAPSFIITKKDGLVRFISDLRQLKKQIKRMPYPITHIKDILKNLSNFYYATTLYLIMDYYNISLTDVAKKVCTIITPFGKYKQNCLPMGVCIVPDIFQEQMSALMDKLKFCQSLS